MTISLAPDLERFLAEQVQTGRYSSTDEAVRKAVELLKETEESERRLEASYKRRKTVDLRPKSRPRIGPTSRTKA